MLDLWQKIEASDLDADAEANCLREIAVLAKNSQKIADIKFGTSGWRGIIGEDFTVLNVKIATQAIIEMLKSDVYLKSNGFESFEEVQKRGILIGRDNRFLGPFFVDNCASVLASNKINAFIIDRPAITPDLSLVVPKKGFAGSINFTPSHNPFMYSGIKFNPSDGGPADVEITSIIEKKTKQIAQDLSLILDFAIVEDSEYIHKFQSLPIYVSELKKSGLIDFEFINQNFHNIIFAVDNVYGASYGYVDYILPECDFLALRNRPNIIFKKLKPEPSSKNLELCNFELARFKSYLRLGVILDPDGDRVRFTDGIKDIDMNVFGAIAMHYLITQKKWSGGVVKSVATSNFVNAIAEKLNRPVFETAVGFKNFRQYLKNKEVVCAFEESDGITLQNHTLEKDGIIGALLALEITLRTKKPLSVYYEELQAEYGVFYPLRESTEIDENKKNDIKNKLSSYKIGDEISGLKIADIINIDGFKFVFEDKSWFLIRPSGTEPKVRIYVEAKDQIKAKNIFEIAKKIIL